MDYMKSIRSKGYSVSTIVKAINKSSDINAGEKRTLSTELVVKDPLPPYTYGLGDTHTLYRLCLQLRLLTQPIHLAG